MRRYVHLRRLCNEKVSELNELEKDSKVASSIIYKLVSRGVILQIKDLVWM
ncbi:MAG: hypothetical protein ACR5KW_01840 [Wolbachia sp.]